MTDSHNSAVLEHVAANLKRLRAEHHLSQQILAEKSGISRRMIAALENGNANISLAKLDQLATVFEVSFAQLVSPFGNTENAKRNILAWRGARPGSEAYLSCSFKDANQVELWMWAIAPGDQYQAEADPQGWNEMLHVIEGSLTVRFSNETQVLSAGESVVYASSQPYCYLNQSDSMVRFVRNVIG